MLKPLFAALVALALLGSFASAQTYKDSAGTIVHAFVPLGGCVSGGGSCAGPAGSSSAPTYVTSAPYPFTPLSPGQHNIAPTTSTALTIPAGSTYATVCGSTAVVKYTTDGTTTPTATVGQPLAAGSCVSLSGPTVIANARFFSTAGTLDIEYFK